MPSLTRWRTPRRLVVTRRLSTAAGAELAAVTVTGCKTGRKEDHLWSCLAVAAHAIIVGLVRRGGGDEGSCWPLLPRRSLALPSRLGRLQSRSPPSAGCGIWLWPSLEQAAPLPRRGLAGNARRTAGPGVETSWLSSIVIERYQRLLEERPCIHLESPGFCLMKAHGMAGALACRAYQPPIGGCGATGLAHR